MFRLKPDDIFLAYPNHPNILPEHRANAEVLTPRVNSVLQAFEDDGNAPLTLSGVTGTVLSTQNAGWRPPVAPGARNSAHKVGAAADLHDPNARLDKWIMHRPKMEDPETGRMEPDVLVLYNLYMEDPSATQGQVTKGGWCHLATRKPLSGKRVFLP